MTTHRAPGRARAALALLALSACAASLAQAPAAAPPQSQGQTPANAHAFFTAVVQSQAVLLADLMSTTDNRPRQVSAVDSGGCFTRVAHEEQGRLVGVHSIDWRAVRRVRVQDGGALRLQGPGIDMELSFEDAEMTQRVSRALALVRRTCDPTNGYAF